MRTFTHVWVLTQKEREGPYIYMRVEYCHTPLRSLVQVILCCLRKSLTSRLAKWMFKKLRKRVRRRHRLWFTHFFIHSYHLFDTLTPSRLSFISSLPLPSSIHKFFFIFSRVMGLRSRTLVLLPRGPDTSRHYISDLLYRTFIQVWSSCYKL